MDVILCYTYAGIRGCFTLKLYYKVDKKISTLKRSCWIWAFCLLKLFVGWNVIQNFMILFTDSIFLKEHNLPPFLLIKIITFPHPNIVSALASVWLQKKLNLGKLNRKELILLFFLTKHQLKRNILSKLKHLLNYPKFQ